MEKPLRIAVFHDLPSGGAKRTIHAQVSGLVERGHRVECYVTSNAEEEIFPLKDVASRLTTIHVPEPPNRERTLSGRPSPKDLIRWLELYHGIRKTGALVAEAVTSADFDVLLAHPSQFTQAPHILRHSAIPTVYYCHEVLRAAYEPLISPFHVRMAIRLTLARVDRRNAQGATAIAVNSKYTSQRVAQVYGRNSTVVSPGVDLARFKPTHGPRKNFVLAVGALHPLKGIDLILKALGRLPPTIRPPLIIVSDRVRSQERARIESLSRTLNVKVELRERVPESQLAELYAQAKALAFAAHSEPLGLVPLEAMASGTPVVAVAEGGVPETVVDGITGLLVPRDSNAFAQAIRQIIESPENAEEMGRRGREFVEEMWSWDRSVDRLIKLISETIVGP